MGIVAPSGTPIYREAVEEVRSIMKAADEIQRPSRARVKLWDLAESARGMAAATFGRFMAEKPGACLRCGSEVPFDPAKPYCASCFASWKRFSNENYVEKHCHDCGGSHRASMAKPLCRSCYAKAVA